MNGFWLILERWICKPTAVILVARFGKSSRSFLFRYFFSHFLCLFVCVRFLCTDWILSIASDNTDDSMRFFFVRSEQFKHSQVLFIFFVICYLCLVLCQRNLNLKYKYANVSDRKVHTVRELEIKTEKQSFVRVDSIHVEGTNCMSITNFDQFI